MKTNDKKHGTKLLRTRLKKPGIFYWANIIAFSLFLMCLFFAVRWSSYPIGIWPFGLEKIFISSYTIDSSMLNLTTGYVSGYIVYLLTTLLPTYVRNIRMQKNAIKSHLIPIYTKIIYTLLLMCKNSSTKEHWEKIVKNNDLDCFNDMFFERMRLFDLRCNADTLFLKKDSKEPIKWFEHLENLCKSIDDELYIVFSQYQGYLTEEMVNCILELRTSRFIEMFAGRATKFFTMATGKDGYDYNETFPIGMIYESTDNLTPIFYNDKKVLEELIFRLKDLYELLSNHSRNELIKKDFAISKLKNEKIGHLASAIFTLPDNRKSSQAEKSLPQNTNSMPRKRNKKKKK